MGVYRRYRPCEDLYLAPAPKSRASASPPQICNDGARRWLLFSESHLTGSITSKCDTHNLITVSTPLWCSLDISLIAYYILNNPMLIQTYMAEPAVYLTAKSTSRTNTEMPLTKEAQNVEGILEMLLV